MSTTIDILDTNVRIDQLLFSDYSLHYRVSMFHHFWAQWFSSPNQPWHGTETPLTIMVAPSPFGFIW